MKKFLLMSLIFLAYIFQISFAPDGQVVKKQDRLVRSLAWDIATFSLPEDTQARDRIKIEWEKSKALFSASQQSLLSQLIKNYRCEESIESETQRIRYAHFPTITSLCSN